MGYNNWGQLGMGDSLSRYTPEQITAPTGVVFVSAGYEQLFLIDQHGAVRGARHEICFQLSNNSRCAQVWAAGRNRHGQLGLGDSDIDGCTTLDRCDTPKQLPVPTNVVHVSAGAEAFGHTVLVDQDGTVRHLKSRSHMN